jgi:DNA-binding NtrC family response regulator
VSGLTEAVSARRRALVIDDDHQYVGTVLHELKQRGLSGIGVGNLEQATERLERDEFGVVVVDNRFSGRARGATYVRENDWILRGRKVILVTGTIDDIGDPQWLQDHDVQVLLKGEPSHVAEVVDLVHDFASRELNRVRSAAEGELRRLEESATGRPDSSFPPPENVSRIGEKMATMSVNHLHKMLNLLPEQDRPQFMIGGREYSPAQLREELDSESDIAIKLVDMLLDDLVGGDE